MYHPTNKATIAPGVIVPPKDKYGCWYALYLTHEPATGDFYIGKVTTGRSGPVCRYMGSGAWVSSKSPYDLETEIISYHASTEAMGAAEIELIALMRTGDTAAKCRNITKGGEGGLATMEELSARQRRAWITRRARKAREAEQAALAL